MAQLPGWNDPPQFAYDSTTKHSTGAKSLFNRRVAFPVEGGVSTSKNAPSGDQFVGKMADGNGMSGDQCHPDGNEDIKLCFPPTISALKNPPSVNPKSVPCAPLNTCRIGDSGEVHAVDFGSNGVSDKQNFDSNNLTKALGDSKNALPNVDSCSGDPEPLNPACQRACAEQGIVAPFKLPQDQSSVVSGDLPKIDSLERNEDTGEPCAISEPTPNVPDSIRDDQVMDVLRNALAGFVDIPPVNKSGIEKRFFKLEECISGNKLSPGCLADLLRLTIVIQNKRWDEAYSLHTAMVVDHQAEVISWIPAIRSLILEGQKI